MPIRADLSGSGSQSAAGTAPTPARLPGGRTGSEHGLDGGRDELCGLRVNDDIPAEQNTADDLPGVRRRVLRSCGHVSAPC